jgi:hypothetical protein
MKTRTSIYHRKFSFAYMLLMAVIIFGCDERQERPPIQTEQRGTDDKNYETIVIDSCEYLIRTSIHQGFMSHKGNCKFCKQRSNK